MIKNVKAEKIEENNLDKLLTVTFNIPDVKNSATKYIQFPKNVLKNTHSNNNVIHTNLK